MPEEPRRVSPPTARAVAVLDFLARYPHDRFGLSEIARRVGLAKPTTLGIVTTLTEAGYLVRDSPNKTYRLGPSLITLGRIAQESMRVGPIAHAELRRLSAAFGTTAALSAVVDDRITLLELVGPPGVELGVGVGQSYPFAPPVGLMFVLWDDEALRSWLDKTPAIPLPTDTKRLDRVITECRSEGYLVERLTPAGRRLYALMAGMSSRLPDELQALMAELVSDVGERVHLRSDMADGGPSVNRRRHDVSVISAPVYDRHHRQVMVMSLQIGHSLTDAQIVRHGRGLITAADALTAQQGGAKPDW